MPDIEAAYRALADARQIVLRPGTLTILLFGSEEHVDRWCTRRGMPRGALVTLEQTWSLARAWYERRLDPDYRRPTPAEATAAFASAGLTGSFWDLESG